MSNQNSPEKPVFKVSEKMYQQLLDWQEKEQNKLENSTNKNTQEDQLESQKKKNQNDN